MTACLLLAACGESTPVATDQAMDDAPDESSDAQTAEDSTEADEDVVVEDPAEEEDVAVDEPNDNDSVTVSSFDDIPDECRDLMSAFLKDIEPIVSPVDWDNATMADFEQVSVDFEARAEQFDLETAETEQCDDLDLDSDEGFNVLVEFGAQEAPGTVGFLTFLADLASGIEDTLSPGADGSFETCDDAIAFFDDLMNQYETGAEVPISELTAIGGITAVMFSCTPEQLEYFDSPDVSEFFDSLG